VRMLLKTAVMAITLFAAPVVAQQAKPAYSTADTDIGTLIDNPETKAILDKHMPGFSANEQVAMARGMTLRAVQSMVPDQIKAEALDKIDADLTTLKPKM
jgi:hypothetical protein